ncbi:MAG: T9SS type A sorting domain-containing protein [Bacteroidales bacterium]|nr:T9SS type A sorting domain-containing protein [Bacteroidales bacterium]
MKTVLYLIALIVFPLVIQAQIANPGFENWTNFGTYDSPDSWGNLNATTASTGIFTVTKGTTAPASGAAYIKLMTREIGGNTITPGIIVTGQLDPVTHRPISGFAYTGRPEKLKGKWQYMGYGADVASISAWLTRWNPLTQQRDTIARLNGSPSGMLHSWGNFSFSFEYQSGNNPDTAVVMISSSSQTPVKNSFIWIDDVSFDGTVTGLENPVSVQSFNVFPNPATSYTKVNLVSQQQGLVRIVLSDNIGNQVLETEEGVSVGSNQITLDLSSGRIKSGIYFLQVYTSSQTYARKLIIRK